MSFLEILYKFKEDILSLPLWALPFWEYHWWNNSVKDYALAALFFLLFLIVLGICQRIILSRFRKLAEGTPTEADDVFIQILRSIRPPFYFYLSFWLALGFLSIDVFVQQIINAVLIVWIVYQFIAANQILIDYILKRRFSEEDSKTIAPFVLVVTKGVFWTIGLLLILSNLGVNITSLVAGLGVGGIAIAFAAQSILSDLFSSFAIHADKPFVVGDFVVLGEEKGTIAKVGLRTTRLKSLSGEEVVIPNREISSVRIHNYKKMERRRVKFSFGVTYDTPVEKLKKIPEIVRDILNKVESVQIDRVHFYQFGDFALLFEVVYFVASNEYGKYMDANQEIHFQVKERFQEEGISMAFPTQTVHLHKETARRKA